MAGFKGRLTGPRRLLARASRMPGRVSLPLLEKGFATKDFANAVKGRNASAVVVLHTSGLVLVSGAKLDGDRTETAADLGFSAATLAQSIVRMNPAGTLVEIPCAALVTGLRQPVSVKVCTDPEHHVYLEPVNFEFCPEDGEPWREDS